MLISFKCNSSTTRLGGWLIVNYAFLLVWIVSGHNRQYGLLMVTCFLLYLILL